MESLGNAPIPNHEMGDIQREDNMDLPYENFS